MSNVHTFIKSNKKKYYETWACLLLTKLGLLPSPFSFNWMKDRPDIQVNNYEYGIEITEAISEYEGEQNSIRNDMLECGDFTNASLYSHKKNKTKAVKIGDTNSFGLIDKFGIYNEDDIYNNIIKQINDKNIKYRKYSNYANYNKKGLFIKAVDNMIGSLLYPIFNDVDIKEEINKSIFDIVYLYLNNTLYVYEKGEEKNVYNLKQSEVVAVNIGALKVLNCPQDLIEQQENVLQYVEEQENIN